MSANHEVNVMQLADQFNVFVIADVSYENNLVDPLLGESVNRLLNGYRRFIET